MSKPIAHPLRAPVLLFPLLLALSAAAGSEQRPPGVSSSPAPEPAPAPATAPASAPAPAPSPLSLFDAIRVAWAAHPALQAAATQIDAAREQAQAADHARYPSVAFGARALVTTEPVAAFGLKLDQGRIAQPDFDPALLNSPDPAFTWGVSAAVTQPIYAGGRIDAGRRATTAMLEAAGQDLERHRQVLASAVAEAYFGSQVAEQGVNYAEEQLAHARETEAFVKARAKEGAVLEADALRATAYRAQASAELEIARQRVGSARSALALLVNDEAAAAALSTTLDVPSTSASTEPPAGQAATPRADLLAARARARAADDGAVAARGSLLPEVFAQLAVDTALRKPDEGRIWTTAFVGARWQLSFGAQDEAMAALARARGAAYAARWQERQAGREVAEARRAFEAAVPQIAAAQEAIAAGEAVRTQRRARHQQGLLPLTEVLDAEAGLAGARTLLLRAQLESRLALVHLQLALGQPVEGVTP